MLVYHQGENIRWHTFENPIKEERQEESSELLGSVAICCKCLCMREALFSLISGFFLHCFLHSKKRALRLYFSSGCLAAVRNEVRSGNLSACARSEFQDFLGPRKLLFTQGNEVIKYNVNYKEDMRPCALPLSVIHCWWFGGCLSDFIV